MSILFSSLLAWVTVCRYCIYVISSIIILPSYGGHGSDPGLISLIKLLLVLEKVQLCCETII